MNKAMAENENTQTRKIRWNKLYCIDMPSLKIKTRCRNDISKRRWPLSDGLGFPGHLPKKEGGRLQKMEGGRVLQNGRNASQGQVF